MALLVCSVVLAVFLTMIRDYFTETDPEDIASRYREEVSGLQNECARKDAESCTIRGRDYRAGLRKLQKDSEKGLEYAVKGCEYGSGTGGVVAGVISMDDKAGGPGPGVFFEKACDMNLPSAISELCTRKDRAFPGTARPPDGIMIVSAVQGDAEGCYAPGLLCYEKRLKDESGRAPRLCGTSCKAGIKAACGILRRLSPAPESPEESQKDEA